VRPAVIEKVAGTTVKVTFVSSGSVPSLICSAILDKNETLINSQAAVGSQTNFYVLHPVPSTPGWYINQWVAVIQANTYVERQFLRVRTMEVD
jgi:hypothetical protein